MVLNRWELVAAVQALSIYILVRLDEGETEYNNLDYLISKTVIVSLVALAKIRIYLTACSGYF